jgi:phage terminase Nu1 subunit (DNA packaging protein)
MSLRAYATRRGVSSEAVSKAISAGRLRDSVERVRGIPKIADPELADREWEENTRPVGGGSDDRSSYNKFRELREEELWKQAQLKRENDELELAVRKGQFVPVAEVEAKLGEEYGAVRTRLLALPARLKQYLTHLSVSDVRLIETLIREALEELSSGEETP